MTDTTVNAGASFTDELKRVYEGQGALDRYYDATVPCDLYRGNKKSGVPLMQPTLIGWKDRRPDVLVTDAAGRSPQYQDEGLSVIATEKKGEKTAAIVGDAEKLVVKGCRTLEGNHRGVSVFDKVNQRLRMKWYKLPAGVEIPPGLAITRDGPKTAPYPVHYTVAPKDDMPLDLFLKTLEGLASKAVEVK